MRRHDFALQKPCLEPIKSRPSGDYFVNYYFNLLFRYRPVSLTSIIPGMTSRALKTNKGTTFTTLQSSGTVVTFNEIAYFFLAAQPLTSEL